MLQLGTPVDHVSLEIDLHIIEHFSKHLYSSPTKAVEELVANGYDAAATKVKVYLPGKFTENVIIWDNGTSMDVAGLKGLWKVADSPKNSEEARRVDIVNNGTVRNVIGKFGIGKIASYTIGSQIYHICKTSDKFLSVGIDYEVLLKESKKDTGKAFEQSDIYELTESQAKQILEASFREIPSTFKQFFDSPTWTFAIIEQLKDIALPEGRIKWVLGNGMPIQPQFSVEVNDQKITSNLFKTGVVCEWDFSQKEIQEQLRKNWDDGVKAGKVSGVISFGKEAGLNPENADEKIPFVKFPSLGKVWGINRLYAKSLLNNRVSDFGRSHGFFIVVRGRLINQDDAQFLLSDPSFATFYSSQYILHADGLDNELLADRERIQESSLGSRELQLLQKAVYLALAAMQRKQFDLLKADENITNRLPVSSSEYFLEPLSALWIKSGSGNKLGFDFREPIIESKPLGEKNQISKFDSNLGFTVNSDHPYYQNLTKLLGSSKQGQKVVKEFEVIAVSEKLFEGHLFEIGIPEEQIEKIMQWRDEMYRKIAKSDKLNLSQLASTLIEASFTGSGSFERAIADVLNTIGFVTTVDGKSGQKDGFIRAFCGTESYKLTFEAKGSTAASLSNDDAETGGANSHRKMAGADHAVIVARKFAGFEKGDSKPAIIKECLATDGKVSIMETDALIKIAYAVKEHSYSLDSLKEVFTTIETPKEKNERIEKLQKPLNDFDYSELLDKVWEQQDELGDGEFVAVKPIWQRHFRKLDISEEDFYRKIEALRTLAYPLIQWQKDQREIALMQSPENIKSLIKNKF